MEGGGPPAAGPPGAAPGPQPGLLGASPSKGPERGNGPVGDGGSDVSFCVHIQGLPMLATHGQIKDFFSGLSVLQHRGIQIVHDGAGKPLGEGKEITLGFI